MSEFAIDDRNRVRRVPRRAAYDRETIYDIVDAGLICHVGLVEGNRPVVIPTIHARQADTLLLHGASTSRLVNHVAAGEEICVTITHLDGLVLARSVFHHSMNYRSAVLFGRGHLIEEDDEKMKALEQFTEKLIPGRWTDARLPTPNELKATHVVAIPIDAASAKVRTGPPGDDEADYDLDVWAGVLPMRTLIGAPEPDPRLKAGVELPDYVRAYAGDRAR